MTTPQDSLLGRSVGYPDRYDPSLLFPISRAAQRAALGIGSGALPFHGVDIWNAYELSWLDARGKPEIAIAEIRVPATTPNIVESKSLKLYLASFHRERFADFSTVRAQLLRDLARAAGEDIEVALTPPERFSDLRLETLVGECIDAVPAEIDRYGPPDPDLLEVSADGAEETLVSHLLKTNCPVTGQPDWASIQITYSGPRIDRAGLLRYLVSFREHADFHEHCVERIYVDLLRRCVPERLTVHARYTRRGGIDINPWRSSEPGSPPNPRIARQ